MPNTKSAQKRLRQSQEQRIRNRSAKSSLRSQLRRVIEAVQQGQIDKAEQEYLLASRRLDQAGARRLIHPNTAARGKSRRQRLIKSAKTSRAPAQG